MTKLDNKLTNETKGRERNKEIKRKPNLTYTMDRKNCAKKMRRGYDERVLAARNQKRGQGDQGEMV